MMKKILTIAGSDCSGGAGIQADIKTITAHKLYAMSAITALTAQNTTGVYGILDVPIDMVENQLDCIFSDIRPDAIKVGMVSRVDIIQAIVRKLNQYNAQNIVVDPVMVSTSGSKLLSDEAITALIKELIPLGTVITPNIFEAQVLCGFGINDEESMIRSAQVISQMGVKSVLIKGGHFGNQANDLLYKHGDVTWFNSERIDNPNTHGTGCTLSSAIACNLGMGYSLKDSIQNAKDYITCAIKANLDLGKGRGPLNHMCNL
ncbi:bifunctional hydroxymethylpyrimidine kinase/phosphomethylpyrimidine kinase [Candidatus Epulonipiscium fishelsonii]|uniref:Bifunctional hydroxymethylpyrimidine kinase/phosphomethylpyrimidine kinase n=1 Tax=Candidatus Epulonipiscium fishelsonii TaxID=77094 RepID=A0ACC8XBH6_9FIRM|nr:bifunctional hydroxymethylpyrimidine kinase/phosphomethylpyrimidine kinase [Epulopiscium sp. SCG-B11WGA-EpuloA1]ONI41271.1 bifunctional hydroxymethylpyrimidine kinase/phosphomethylpyrimidine kinase [Epulopiscium sp. SCG-B05WGA-EpuloA1]